MEMLNTRKFVGIDLSEEAVQLSIYDEGTEQMTEECFPLPDKEDYLLPDIRQDDYFSFDIPWNSLSI